MDAPFSRLWEACKNTPYTTEFSLQLGMCPAIHVHLSADWPNGIQNALALNHSIAHVAANDWHVYALSGIDDDITKEIAAYDRNQHGKLQLHDPNILAAYDATNHIFRLYDLDKKYAVIITPPDHTFLPWDIHSPFREFFHLFALHHGGMLIHSGTVTHNKKCILLPGAGGTGKSTTVLSCLQAGMQTTGDDYNLIFPRDNGYIAVALYANLKIKHPSDGTVPMEFSVTKNWHHIAIEQAAKTLYRPAPDSPIWDKHQPTLVGILCPEIPDISSLKPSLLPMRHSALLQRLAISSIMQSPLMAQRYLSAAALLAKKLPCAIVSLSSDVQANAMALKTWLAAKEPL